MSSSREQQIALLTYCVNDLQGISHPERALLRDILSHLIGGSVPLWGVMNLNRADEVKALFAKCMGLMNDAPVA